MKDEEKKLLIESISILDAMWGHHQDGSDCLVNEHQMFNIVFNHVIKRLNKVLKLTTGETRDFKDLKENEWFCTHCGLVTKYGGPCIHCGDQRQIKIKNFTDSFWKGSTNE